MIISSGILRVFTDVVRTFVSTYLYFCVYRNVLYLLSDLSFTPLRIGACRSAAKPAETMEIGDDRYGN